MASDNYGVSFSPISGDQTEEELQRMLERLFGGAKPSISALPRPKIRGVIDNLFASLLSGGVRRPEISEILAPPQPAVTEAPEGLPEEAPAPAEELAPEATTSEEGEPVAPGTEEPEGPEGGRPGPHG